ncbi:hypothetical protein PF010_g4467 [Phytophthora fragariae]|uniref:DUF6818 domain-containing protein n=1 Tax=Phytophthora fragariae TaxID=53985 RepID=A0A6G0LSP0_9STRA|nr:hypothetical protein PF010_g4467 [Phytophthora fragariae]
MKAGYDGSFRQESMAFSSPEVIVIDDSSDDEEQVLAFPSEERPVKSEFYDPLPGSRGEAARDGLGAHIESSASTVDHHDVDDCPSAKKRQRELFRSSVGPFSDGKAAAALALKSRHAKRAPPPTRLNSTIRKVAVRRNSDSVGDLPVTPSPPPDAKAMIQSSPISKFAEATRSLTAQATAAAPAKIFVDAPWPPRVAYLHDYYNPKTIKLPYVHHFGDCGCDDPCKIDTCRNARMNLLCTDSCCIWEELCSNRPRESPKFVNRHLTDKSSYQASPTRMGKPPGSMNYSLPEVMHMLAITKKILPQGKDMWESVAARYDATKDSHWPERDLESLRRKFKSLSVFITTDDDEEEDGQQPREGCQTPRPPLGPPGSSAGLMQSTSSAAASALQAGSSRECDVSGSASQDGTSSDNFGGYESTGTLPFSLSDDDGPSADDMFSLEEAFKAAAKPSAKGVLKPKVVSGAAAKMASQSAKARITTDANKPKKSKTTPTTGASAQSSTTPSTKQPTTADARERLRYPKLSDTSDRLGGVNLADMRDAMKKRPYEEFEEASYTKQKRLKAEKAAAELKRQLSTVEQTAAGSGTDLIKTIMVLRADAEKVDMERRREERQADREAMEERRREDRREARQHMQDMLLMLASLRNGAIPSVSL